MLYFLAQNHKLIIARARRNMSQGQESSNTFTLNKGLVSMIYARISVLLQKKKSKETFWKKNGRLLTENRMIISQNSLKCRRKLFLVIPNFSLEIAATLERRIYIVNCVVHTSSRRSLFRIVERRVFWDCIIRLLTYYQADILVCWTFLLIVFKWRFISLQLCGTAWRIVAAKKWIAD